MNFTQKEQKKCSEIKEKYYGGCINNSAFKDIKIDTLEQAKVWRVKMKTRSPFAVYRLGWEIKHLISKLNKIDSEFASIVENILGEHMEELKEKFELLKSGELYKRFLQNKESDTIK